MRNIRLQALLGLVALAIIALYAGAATALTEPDTTWTSNDGKEVFRYKSERIWEERYAGGMTAEWTQVPTADEKHVRLERVEHGWKMRVDIIEGSAETSSHDPGFTPQTYHGAWKK